jgi:hypothetical protein
MTPLLALVLSHGLRRDWQARFVRQQTRESREWTIAFKESMAWANLAAKLGAATDPKDVRTFAKQLRFDRQVRRRDPSRN